MRWLKPCFFVFCFCRVWCLEWKGRQWHGGWQVDVDVMGEERRNVTLPSQRNKDLPNPAFTLVMSCGISATIESSCASLLPSSEQDAASALALDVCWCPDRVKPSTLIVTLPWQCNQANSAFTICLNVKYTPQYVRLYYLAGTLHQSSNAAITDPHIVVWGGCREKYCVQ